MTQETSDGYELLDSGDGRKLERFGPWILARPAAQAAWRPRLDAAAWERAHAAFDREDGQRWTTRENIPEEWIVALDGLRFRLSRTDFGHLGIFPEQRDLWQWIDAKVRAANRSAVHTRAAHASDAQHEGDAPVSLLNMFAYSGGATLAAARAGASVCHVDASRGMVTWASENAKHNELESAPIRWIVDDALKFLRREERRARKYDAIVLDPPTFGRGAKGEVYKIDEALRETLDACRGLLSEQPVLVLLTSHTPGYTPLVLENVLGQVVEARGGTIESGEMVLRGAADVLPLPSGAWARWSRS